GLVVADEGQHAKNPLSRTARELRAIPAPARVALTGTPVENRLPELWSILDWTTPGLLGPLERFRRSVAVPVERYRDPAATERLTRVGGPVLPPPSTRRCTRRWCARRWPRSPPARASSGAAWCWACSPPSSRSATTRRSTST